MKFTLKILLAVLLFASPGVAQVSVTANFKDITGTNVTSNAEVNFELQNYGSEIPKVTTSGVVVQVKKVFKPDASGLIHCVGTGCTDTVYQNSVITPAGTFYRVCVINQGTVLRCNNYLINSSFNLNSATPLNVTPNVGPNQIITQSFVCPVGAASTVWTCTHNFNDSNVQVQAFNSSGAVIYPDSVTATTPNIVTVNFVTAQAGVAVILHAGSIAIATNQPNAVLQNPTGSQTVVGQPFNTGGGGLHTGTETFTGSILCKNLAGVRCIDPINSACWVSCVTTDFGAIVNAAAADVGKGLIQVACGSYTMSMNPNFDGLTGIRLIGEGGITNGALACVSVTYTGSASPAVSARSSIGIEIGHIQWLWNNAAFTGDFFNSGHSTSSDTNGLWVHHCSFYKTGSGVNLTNLLNLDKTISSEIGPQNYFNHANVAILGANADASYANVIHIHDNHFSSSTGTIVQAMIRNLSSGSEINANTFEMGSAAGSPFVFDSNVLLSPNAIDFHGNWVGDVGATYNGTLFNLLGHGGGSGNVGINIHGNLIGGNSLASVRFFNITSGAAGIEICGNSLQADGAISLISVDTTVSNVLGVKVCDNFISSSPAIVTAINLTVVANLGAFEFTGNGWNGNPTTFLSGAPTSGVIYSVTNSPTYYGNYRQINGDMTFLGVTTFSGNPILNSSGFQAFPGGFNITGGAANLPTSTGSTLRCIGNGTPVLGACYIGDGTGYQFNFRKRTGSTDTDLFQFLDSGKMLAANSIRASQQIADQGLVCTNGELALSAGWQSTGSASVTAVAGTGQTCSWTITTGTTTAANPTITDTLTNPLPTATTICWMNIYGGTHTAVAGESLRQTTLSATAPVFTANFTPTAAGATYFVTRSCGP